MREAMLFLAGMMFTWVVVDIAHKRWWHAASSFMIMILDLLVYLIF